jgi:pyrroline-5-carboxylate reductase
VFLLRQNEMWQSVITELNRSLYGEQMVCSMSTQLFHIPETKDLQGNAEMHIHLVPASYHRVTATGSALRLLNGESALSIVETLITCIQKTEHIDRNVHAGLLVMKGAAPASYKQFVENIIRWQEYTEFHLQNAKQFAIRITGSTAWHEQSRYGELSRD